MPTDFNEIRLPTDIEEASEGSVLVNNEVVSFPNWKEQYLKFALDGRLCWTIGFGTYDQARLAVIIAFWRVHEDIVGFRFRDWTDYNFDDPDTGDPVPSDTVLLTATTFQIQKVYSAGVLSYNRKIRKVDATDLTNAVATQANSTARVYNASSVEVTSGWTVDVTTGIITYAAPPGYLPKAICDFDVPVRFDQPPKWSGKDNTRSMSGGRVVEWLNV